MIIADAYNKTHKSNGLAECSVNPEVGVGNYFLNHIRGK